MKLKEILEEAGPWTEVPSTLSLDERFGIIQRRFETARKMLGLTNKLQNAKEKKLHRSRIMKILNDLRRELKTLMHMLAQGDAR